MIKKIASLIFISLLFIGCNEEVKSDDIGDANAEVSNNFNSLLENYYEDGLKLNPLSATAAGDNRYNDQGFR